MTPDTPIQPPPDGSGGFEKLAAKARVEFRMVTDGQPITDEVRNQIIGELEAYRNDHHDRSGGGPLSWGRLADMVGVSPSCISDIRGRKYKGNTDEVLVKIDQFLADDRERAGRFDFASTAKISITEAIFGTIRSGIRMNTMPVIIATSGVGKTQHSRAFAADRTGVVTIRIDEKNADSGGVTKLLCNAIDGLRPSMHKPAAARLLLIKDWLRRKQSTVIIVDECQKLVRSGLEMLRDIHDLSDATGRRNVPIVFFGDQDFLKLILAGRAGQRSPISPQCIRRMRPVLNVNHSADTVKPDGGLFTVDDILTIVRNNRVKLLSTRAAKWLKALANVIEYGALGNAMGVLQMCVDNLLPAGATKLDRLIEPADLEEALKMTFGDEIAIEIDQLANGELLGHAKAAVA